MSRPDGVVAPDHGDDGAWIPGPTTATTHEPLASRRDGTPRRAMPLALGVAATVLSAIGLSGVGDAPDPKAPAADIAGHFADNRRGVLTAAPFAYLGAIALVLLAVHVARRLRRAGQPGPAVTLTVGAALCATYLAGIQIAYTALAYQAAASAETIKAVFVATILATPVLGGGLAALLGGLAWGDRHARLVPGWLVVGSAIGAVVASLALVSFDQRGLFSPDLQQQITGNILLLWPLAAGGALAWRSRRR